MTLPRTPLQALHNLAPYLERWALQADGPTIVTHSSDLLPVRFLGGVRQGGAAMLKLAHSPEEVRGHGLMTFWARGGAAQVYAQSGPALLLERLDAAPSLTQMVEAGEDKQATQILCAVAAQLHQPRPHPWPELLPLPLWFASLQRQAGAGGVWQDCWQVAQSLLQTEWEDQLLHGDLHHANILPRAGAGDWCAIDPKGLLGERGFDFANLFFNPHPSPDPAQLERRLAWVSQIAGLDPQRLLGWIAAYGGLSAAWHREDDDAAQAQKVLAVAQMALHLREP